MKRFLLVLGLVCATCVVSCSDDDPQYDENGVLIPPEKPNPMGMIMALREIAKLQGYYAADRVSVDVRGIHDADFARMNLMSDAELAAIVEAGNITDPLALMVVS